MNKSKEEYAVDPCFAMQMSHYCHSHRHLLLHLHLRPTHETISICVSVIRSAVVVMDDDDGGVVEEDDSVIVRICSAVTGIRQIALIFPIRSFSKVETTGIVPIPLVVQLRVKGYVKLPLVPFNL